MEISALYVRSGRVVEATSFSNPRVEVPDDEVVAAFLREHYGDSGPGDALIPDEILMPMLPEGSDGVAEWLTEKRQAALRETKPRARCQLITPCAAVSASCSTWPSRTRGMRSQKRRAAEDVDERLARVQQRLRLPTLPRRIECCDISHLGGNAPSARWWR